MLKTIRFWRAAQDLALPAVPRNSSRRSRAKWTLVLIANGKRDTKCRASARQLLAQHAIYIVDLDAAKRSA
jgi:hypothetical protein